MNITIEFHIFKLILVPNFRWNLLVWFFWPDLPKNGFSDLKQKKWTPHIFYIIVHIQISLARNFSSNWQFSFFGPNLTTKVFPVKNWKLNIINKFCIIQISLGTKFPLKLTIFIFWTKFAQKGISSRNRKSEDDHGILHIWISLGTKVQPKLIVFSFLTTFTQKRYFQSKTEQAVQGLCSKR